MSTGRIRITGLSKTYVANATAAATAAAYSASAAAGSATAAQTARTGAETARTGAEAAAALAVDISNIGVPDDVVEVLVGDTITPSATRTKLDSAFVGSLAMSGAGIDPTGVADSTAAMQAKLTAAVAFGVKHVHIPAGTYRANLTIPHPDQRVGIKIVGDGVGHTVLKGVTSAPVVTVGDGDPVFDAQFVSMEHLTIDANSAAASCVKLNHSRFFKLYDAHLLNATTYGIDGAGGQANYFAHFLRVQIRLCPINVYLDGGSGIGANSNYFEKCHFSGQSNVNYNGTGTAICVVVNGGDSNIFEGCEFTGVGTSLYFHNSAVYNKVLGNQFDGPTTAVHIATTGVQGTRIMYNTGTVVVNDSGNGTMFMGTESSAADLTNLLYGRAGLVIGGPRGLTNVTPLRVRAVVGQTADPFRVEKSDATTLFRVNDTGNIETGPAGAVTAHGHSTFDNAGNGSVSMTVDTGPTTSTANLALRVRARHAGQTGDLTQWQNSGGTRMAAIGGKGELKLASFTTAGRPAASAVTAGAGAVIYDSTLGLPIFSDGTNWKNFAGTIV